MCKEDMREGRRKFTSVSVVVATNGVAVQLCGAAKNRTHLMVASRGALAGMRPTELDGDLDASIPYGGTLPPVDMDIDRNGLCVTQAWEASGDAADVPTIVIETFWEDDK